MADGKKKGIVAEFKEFIARGNVIDMAVGVIMGGAFTPIVNSLVNDIVMPCVGMITGGIDFSDKKLILQQAVAADEAAGIAETAEVSIGYGNFIQVILNFLIISLCIFVLIKAINTLKRKEEPKPEPEAAPAPPEPSAEEKLLAEIRDLLRSANTAHSDMTEEIPDDDSLKVT